MSKPSDTFEELKNKLKKASLDLILETFPQKVIELDAMLKEDKWSAEFAVSDESDPIVPEDKSTADQSNGESSPAKKKKKSDDSEDEEESSKSKTCWTAVPSNPALLAMIATMKKLFTEFTDMTLTIATGINLMQPQIEDGNNFGVEVQQELIDQIIAAENDAYSRYYDLQRYFHLRADLITKVIKHPNCEDFRCAIRERDRMFHRYLRWSLRNLRNHYICLHDLTIKNLSKIKKPRTAVSSELLY